MRSRLTAAVALTVALAAPCAFGQERRDPDRGRAPDATEGDDNPQWVWLQTEVGAAQAGLQSFLVDEGQRSAGFNSVSASGPIMGAGAGLRLMVVTLGGRARLALLDRFDVATAGGELGVRVPISVFEPHLDLGFGYAALSDFSSADGAQRDIEADGLYARIGGGLDVHVTRAVTLGGSVSWEILGVTPEGIAPATVTESGAAPRRETGKRWRQRCAAPKEAATARRSRSRCSSVSTIRPGAAAAGSRRALAGGFDKPGRSGR